MILIRIFIHPCIRKLAARALVPLIPPEELVSYGENILTRLSTSKLRMNHTHGLLLQLDQLKKTDPSLLVARKGSKQLPTYNVVHKWLYFAFFLDFNIVGNGHNDFHLTIDI